MEHNDALAAHRTVRQVADLLQDPTDYRPIHSDRADQLARRVVDGFTAAYELRDGQRRTVLHGPWEVDPSPVRPILRGTPARPDRCGGRTEGTGPRTTHREEPA